MSSTESSPADAAPAERHELGQWFTPPAVAELAVRLVAGSRRVGAVADLSCGDGAFLAAARAVGIPARDLLGVELDGELAARARAAVPGATVHHRDLFTVGAGELDVGLVVGNPPYVRQERLDSAVKERIRCTLRTDWPDLPERDLERLVGRGDLAVACMAHILRLLPAGGRAALVVSSALFDAGYAEPLWKLIGRHGRVAAIVDAPAERWFADAAVNAVIVVIERGGECGGDTVIARLSVPTEKAARRVTGPGDLANVAAVFRASADQPHRWAVSLRAHETWFALEKIAGPRLVPLSSLADVWRGITSGGNDIFYLDRERARALDIDPRFLQPLVRSPREREAARIAIDPDATDWLALVVPAQTDLGAHPGLARYLERHEAAAVRPTLRARRPWWALPARPARLFLTKAYAARFVQRLAPTPVVADQRVYAVEPKEGVTAEQLAAVLNSTYTALALESLGRASMGEGALEWTVGDANELPVIDPRPLDRHQRVALVAALQAMAARTIGTAEVERDAADRRQLDLLVAADRPDVRGLLDDVHAALIASATARARRAASAG